jgi:hypothetical protein
MKKEDSPHHVLEEANVAFDPSTQHLDLNKEEKRRTTALMLAINAYEKLIIKDAEYLKEVRDMQRKDEGPVIKPATMDAMVDAAIKFDRFIAQGEKTDEEVTRGGVKTETE